MIEDFPNPALLPAGFVDLLPPEAEREARLIETLMAVFAAHGYERVKPPLLEFEESLLAGSGAAVAEQTFRLMDPVSQRMMGLRADITPQIARIATTRLRQEPRPLRLCYAGQVLRVRGSQLAPARQLAQAGIELIGPTVPEADAEVALLAVEALAAVGIHEVILDVSLPTMVATLFEASGAEEALRPRLIRALDRKDGAAVAALVADRHPALRLLPSLLAAAGPAEAALAVLQAAALPAAAAGIAANAAAVLAAIRARAPHLRITLDPVEFRGFRYHTGVAFTLFGPGQAGELARGGRYATQSDEAATGMTLYPDALLRAAPPVPPRPRLFVPCGGDGAPFRAQGFVTVAALGPGDTPQGLRCTHVLRDGQAVPLAAEE